MSAICIMLTAMLGSKEATAVVRSGEIGHHRSRGQRSGIDETTAGDDDEQNQEEGFQAVGTKEAQQEEEHSKPGRVGSTYGSAVTTEIEAAFRACQKEGVSIA